MNLLQIVDLFGHFVHGYTQGEALASRLCANDQMRGYDFMAHARMLAQGTEFPLVNLTHNTARFEATFRGLPYTFSLVYVDQGIQVAVWSRCFFPRGIPREVLRFVDDVNRGMELSAGIFTVHSDGKDILYSGCRVNHNALTPQALEAVVAEIGARIVALDILLVQNGYVR